MIKNRITAKAAACCAAALLVAYLLSMLYFKPGQTLLASLAVTLRCVIHVSLLIVWHVSLYYRLTNTRLNRLMTAVALLLVFWLVIDTVKFEFAADPGWVGVRYLEYFFYVPLILIPLLGVFIVDCIGKPETYVVPKRMFCLLIPAGLLIGGVLTNDLHQLLFRFHEGVEAFERGHDCGLLYYVMVTWVILLLGVYVVIMLVKKSRVPGSKKVQLLPLGIMLCGAVMWILYAAFSLRVDLTAVDCIVIVSLFENAVQSGLIPSNTNYQQLFASTTIPIQIVDEEYQPHYVSAGAAPLPEEVLRKTECAAVDLGDSLLCSAPIAKGRVVWQSDVSRLKASKEQLDSVCEQLGEENALLKAELDLKQRQAKTDEKNRLYDRVALEVCSQLEMIGSLLERVKQQPELARQLMARIGVIGSYIKRRGNLVLLGEEQRTVLSKELEYCLRESTDNLSLCDVFTSFDGSDSDVILLEHALAAYDFYEAVIERLIDGVSAVLIHLSCKEGGIAMRMQIGCREQVAERLFEDMVLPRGTFTCKIQEEDVLINLSIPRGGGDG